MERRKKIKKRQKVTLENYKQKLGNDFQYYDFLHISTHRILSEDFIEEFQDYVHWPSICEYQQLSEEFIEKMGKHIIWDLICQHQKLSRKFIETHMDKLDYYDVISFQKLSDYFIYKHFVRYNGLALKIIKTQSLSENFITKMAGEDRILWGFVYECQVLSDKFHEKYKNKPEEYNENERVIAIQRRCGASKRVITIRKDNPNIIQIGCFEGTKKEAIEAITEEYAVTTQRDAYIKKVKKCFKQAKKWMKNHEKTSNNTKEFIKRYLDLT